MKLTNKILWRFNLRLTKNYPRPSIKFMKKYFKNKKVIGAEIGVYTGGNAKNILKTLNIEKIYLIDPYEVYEEYLGEKLEEAKKKAFKNTSKFRPKAKFIFEKSEDASKKIPLLDFVYIDGNHEEKFVRQDLNNYYPKINKGGIIAGHDFNQNYPGTIRAVTEFTLNKKLKLFVENKDWWFVKK